MKKWIFLIPLVLSACSAEQDDLRAWMAQQEAGMKGQVKPLPEIKPFSVVDYDAFSQMNPFDSDKFVAARVVVAGGRAPDINRQREPLESYPLESLKMVGVLMKQGKAHALIDAGGSIYQVRAGNYMGQNFGVVTSVSESEVKLTELVEDLNGDWVERTSALYLQEQQETTQ
ncbi:pilus assembly protein PilP [Denitromonas iodatirespirans]|uniref:Pilus assembly protein PilP n=1 Tax=Denitromonas iodatirespirans TaxID=2795389 RepID=A0A944DE14_DENI1|nr:pilus assembly protein PilP [Denitromonas iodatirespirans]MBT0962743.1 pilus assembly protein PilP [Denitromonas iodatirespirans]